MRVLRPSRYLQTCWKPLGRIGGVPFEEKTRVAAAAIDGQYYVGDTTYKRPSNLLEALLVDCCLRHRDAVDTPEQRADSGTPVDVYRTGGSVLTTAVSVISIIGE